MSPGAPGLSSVEAAARLRRDGANALPQAEHRSHWAIVLSVLREPMLLLLLAALAVYLILGDAREALLLGLSVLAVIGLTIYQEQKSERALEALRELGSPRARVLRDGSPRVVPAGELVVGDIILLAEGDRVPADARLLEDTDLHVDESLLTGESVPLQRRSGAAAEEARVHASTLVVGGHGVAEVVATGARTEVGRIGVVLRSLHVEATPMQHEIRRMVLLFAALALATGVTVAVLFLLTRGGWTDAVLAGLTLSIATIPEEFPMILAVFLALGAWRMARHQALVRRTPAIEALGAITVLCTDKTGTLTRNRMAVAELLAGDRRSDLRPALPAPLRQLLEAALLASNTDSIDPMDRALVEAIAGQAEDPGPPAAPARDLLREYPLSPACTAVTHAWRRGGEVFVACKGAPETVADLCRLSADQRAVVLAEVDAMGRRGLRVLAVASARWPVDAVLPPSMHGFDFDWLGLVAFADPLREGVADAVAEAHAAGVRVVMLTGDHRGTARAIAAQAGIAPGSGVVEGRQLDALDDEALLRCASDTNVFARVRPEQKLRLVAALKQAGQVVAMTGDGVNDAPALMSAHVGIAMGQRGTDVAREAAAIVLLDDDFVTVVRAIRLGRTIYDNIQRAVHYILAVHVPIAGLALLPLLGGGPLVLLPLHVVFLELIIDPACSIVFERESEASGADIMRRPPRPPTARLLGVRSLFANLLRGAAMFAAVAAVYAIASTLALPAPQVGALAFTALVTGNLGLIVVYRSGASLWQTLRARNRAFGVVAAAAMGVLLLVTRLPRPADWFGFEPPPLAPWLVAMLLPLAVAALLKASRRERRPAVSGNPGRTH
ncbi:MAG TPA: HAD-IC family P-type ATPase [Thermomonas sp.]|nr:HAD-IC family P-type ATPase [Thermomonas sp.]